MGGGGDADFETVDFAGPSAFVGFGESGVEVGVDFGEAGELCRVGSLKWATEAGVFVMAGCGVGASAHAEFDFAFLEVGEELVPLRVGDVSIDGGCGWVCEKRSPTDPTIGFPYL